MSELERANSEFPTYMHINNVDLYLTTACNLRCRDCMAGDLRDGGEYHAETSFVLETLDKLKGINSVHIAGQGEPFCHPDIFKILDYAGQIVRYEVNVNTNGACMPLEDGPAERFITSLPEKSHIFLSLDQFHETQDSHAKERVRMFKKYCGASDIPLTFSIRVFDKEKEAQRIIEHYKLSKRPTIVNRVLRMGWAKDMKEARYVDLTTLLRNICNNRGYGILPDGTVVADFVPAYFSEDTRPAISVVGNIKDESLVSMFSRRKAWEREMGNNKNEYLASMIKDMGSHPFCISDRYIFSLKSPPLKGFFDELGAGTAKALGDKILNMHLARTREVVSEGGLPHYGHEELRGGEDNLLWGFWQALYRDEFTEGDRENVLQLQRLWRAGDAGYGKSFWKTLIEMKGQEFGGGNAFREFVKIVTDTEEKRKIVGYLNSQTDLLGGDTPKILKLAHDYILWPYLLGRSEKKEKILHEVAREIGYEGPYTNRLYSKEVPVTMPASIGLIEGLIPAMFVGLNSWPKFLATLSAVSVARVLEFRAGFNSKFRGKVKL